MKRETFRITTSAALLMGAAFACGPQPSASNTDGEVIDQAKSGIVKVDNLPNGSGTQYRLSANFIDASTNEQCTVKESGPCRLIECPAARSSLRSKDAGTVTVTDESSKSAVPLFYGGASSGYSGSGFVVDGTLFHAGQNVSVKAAGATVPAFNVTLKAPSPVSVTSPTDSSLSINRSKDFAISWSGATDGNFVFQIAGQSTGGLPALECRFDGKASSGTIPSAALQLLSPGTYNADAFGRTRLVQTAGDWNVSVDVRYYAGTDGNAYKRPAVLQ